MKKEIQTIKIYAKKIPLTCFHKMKKEYIGKVIKEKEQIRFEGNYALGEKTVIFEDGLDEIKKAINKLK